jgi:hypothetical protein
MTRNTAGILSWLIVVAGMILLVTLSDVPTSQATPLLDSPTYVSGPITADTTWVEVGSPYVVIGDVTVNVGVTLTIEPGVIVKFDLGRLLDVRGQLLAEGTVGNEIVFTSLLDDSVGGDTNGDGNATTPAPSDWLYLNINGGEGVFEHVEVRYAIIGILSDYQANSTLTVTDSHIRESGWYGIRIRGGQATITDNLVEANQNGIGSDSGVTFIANNLVQNNDSFGIDIDDQIDSQETATIINNTITNNGDTGLRVGGMLADASVVSNTITSNGGNGIVVMPGFITSPGHVFTPTIHNNEVIGNVGFGIMVNYSRGGGLPDLDGNTFLDNGYNISIGLGGDMRGDTFFPATYPLDYVVTGLSTQNAALTIEPGAVLKFEAGADLTVGLNGEFVAAGTATDPIIFTSFKDDSVGGDANEDGNATTPAPSDWLYLNINGGEGVFEHVEVRYAIIGILSDYQANSTLTVTDSHIRESGWYGIRIRGGQATITDNLVEANQNGIGSDSGVTFIANNLVQNNDSFGIDIDDQIDSQETTTIINNTITNNGDTGLRVGGMLADASVVSNTITSNGGNGIVIATNLVHVTPTLMANVIQNNTQTGIVVLENQANILSSTLAHNGRNVDIQSGSPYLQDNTFISDVGENASRVTVGTVLVAMISGIPIPGT